ncbi:MAG: DUF2442 domain-containing protein [Candidatus Binataceae bacterium]
MARVDLAVEVTWENGEVSVISMRETVGKGGVFGPLADPGLFGKVAVGEAGRWLEWPGGADICADDLWYQAHPGAKIEELELARE